MASSSSSLSSSTLQYRYDVFPSFSGQDVRRTFLSHFIEGLKSKGIKTFIDNGIMRSDYINSELERAIKESRIAVVILSKNYASSSWCLNELQSIMECRDTLGQTVMTIFYDVDPYDVIKQTGDFGKAFEETCHEKAEEQKQRWRLALTQVAVIPGEHSFSWASEAEMISKIVMDVSNELPSTDFDHMVGIEAHVAKMISMLRLDSDEVKIVGIWGPAGIGKATIARALYNKISSNFELKFYREPVWKTGSNRQELPEELLLLKNDVMDIPDLQETQYRLLRRVQGLHHELLSGILDYRDMNIPELQENDSRLAHQRVLLIVDNVSSEEELQYFLNSSMLLNFGSKVILMIEDQYQYVITGRIDQIYKVAYPSSEEALQIFSYSAFGKSTPPRGYLEHAIEVANLIAPLPLGLKILGSALRGKSKEEWTMAPAKFKTYLDYTDIQKAITFAYDGLSKKHKSLFHSLRDSRYWGKNWSNAKYMLTLEGLDDWGVEKGIQTLADLALISLSGEGEIMMHHSVQLMSSVYYDQWLRHIGSTLASRSATLASMGARAPSQI